MSTRGHSPLRAVLRLLLRSRRGRDLNRHCRSMRRHCRPSRLPAVLLLAALLLVVWAFGSPRPHQAVPPVPPTPWSTSTTTESPCSPGSPLYYTCHLPEDMYTTQGPFDRALRAKVGDNGIIYLTIVDGAVVDMAMNLYLSSFKRHGIQNFLFVCTDKGSIEVLMRSSIGCFDFKQEWIDSKKYRTQVEVFKRKTHIKTKVALSALLLGYTVVMTDVDMVFLKPPYLFIKKYLEQVDMQFLLGGDSEDDPSTAFYVARPTSGALQAHKVTLVVETRPKDDVIPHGNDVIPHENDVTDRRAMLSAIYDLSEVKKLKFRHLDMRFFQDGRTYYETGMRMFYGDNLCRVCVAVHNNGVSSQAAKVYRMKENLLWYLDTGGYYSDPGARYLVYHNPLHLDDPLKTVQLELRTLKDALTLAFLLNRILILPDFHCGPCDSEACRNLARRCALNAYLNIHIFHLYFKDLYREHAFLANPQVPDVVRQSTSTPILIRSKRFDLDDDLSEVKHVFTPDNVVKGAEVEEVVDWFSGRHFKQYSILHFHSLYGAFAGLNHRVAHRANEEYRNFQVKLTVGFRGVGYHQDNMPHNTVLVT